MSASPLVAPGDTEGMLRWLNDRVTVLEQTAIIPVGLIAYCSGDVPGGWLLCDGSSISNTRYGQLAAYLGSTTLPDIAGRVVAGKDAAGTFSALGATGGAETVALTAAQSGLQAHTHPAPAITIGSEASHTHPASPNFALTNFNAEVAAGGAFAAVNAQSSATGPGSSHTHSGSSAAIAANSAVGGAAHSNLQPYIVLNPIIKV